ncbi:hypothetical protein HDE_09132 [Halotydeus destructor]|nr:hypothetical protein HDE_09132 [Halotydeus destructor]
MHYAVSRSEASGGVDFCKIDQDGDKCNQFRNIPIFDNITIVTAATHTPEYKKFAAFFVKQGTEYQALINSGMEPVAVNKKQNGVNQNPTAISFYRTTRKGDEYVVFFDNIFTVQVINFNKIFQAKQPLIVSKSQDYQLASTWLGCPPEICFDSRVDYAYHDEDNNLVLGRGRYFRKIWSLSKISSSMTSEYVQDMFMYKGEKVIFSPGGQIYYNQRSAVFKDLAPESNFADVDAAFALPDQWRYNTVHHHIR